MDMSPLIPPQQLWPAYHHNILHQKMIIKELFDCD